MESVCVVAINAEHMAPFPSGNDGSQFEGVVRYLHFHLVLLIGQSPPNTRLRSLHFRSSPPKIAILRADAASFLSIPTQ